MRRAKVVDENMMETGNEREPTNEWSRPCLSNPSLWFCGSSGTPHHRRSRFSVNHARCGAVLNRLRVQFPPGPLLPRSIPAYCML